MTDIDIHNLQTRKLKVTITWAAVWVCLTIIGTVGVGVFKLGSIWNEQKTYIKETRKIADDALIKSSVNQISISESNKRIDKNAYDIEYLKKVTKN